MKDGRYVENEIMIEGSAAEVWNTLIDPEKTVQYMFGCKVISDWGIGDSIIWQGAHDGVNYVVGHVVKYEPEKALSFTVFDPNADFEDIPENYLTVEYILTSQEGGTHLSVTQGDYDKVEAGDKRYKDTMDQGGWQSVLEKIKALVEG